MSKDEMRIEIRELSAQVERLKAALEQITQVNQNAFHGGSPEALGCCIGIARGALNAEEF